ncbi:MAG: hypothetical protein N3A69_00435 [Leptospiraceae bacterium]|nr:hypothetical protein [Leptospiraceae bacterium]
MKNILRILLLGLFITNIVLAHDVLYKKPKQSKSEPKTFYVLIGLFENKIEAYKFKAKILKSGKGYVLVDELSEEELEKSKLRLLDLYLEE